MFMRPLAVTNQMNALTEKGLAPVHHGFAISRRNTPRFPVTIILGLICENGIVLASDSRTTNPDGTFSDGTQKIYEIGLNEVERFLVATAGHADLGARAIEILSGLAWGKSLTDYRTVADLVQQAVTALKAEIRQQFSGTAEELQKHFRDYHFELVAAHYFAGKPFIFSMDFEIGIVVRDRGHCVARGCGRMLAEFCLHGIDVSKMKHMEAYATAAFAVEEVKKIDSRCGGPLQLALCWAQKQETPGQLSETRHFTCAILERTAWTSMIVEEINKLSGDVNERWKRQTTQVIEGVSRKLEEFMARYAEHADPRSDS